MKIFKIIKLGFHEYYLFERYQQATTNVLPSTTAISDDEMEEKTQWIK